MQHAHQKGVIHRDLKPTNVLVSRHDTTPVAKVIDFGVAKVLGKELTDKTLFMGLAQMVGTPLYMSPEQAGMSDLDVDTRSDIYSLGVLLYELLTGTTPFSQERFRKAAYDEIRRIIREEEPSRPGTRLSESRDALPSISAQRQTEPARLTRLVRGELDWIVMKALEKERSRRYETANGFAADVQRYLADEAVQAVPPSAGYRLRKFVHKHKGRVAAAGVLVLALLGAAGGAVYGLAERRNQRVEQDLRRTAEDARDRLKVALGDTEQARAEVEWSREVLAHFEYGRTMQVAHQEWRDNNVVAMRVLLDGADPKLRGWEWRYLDRLCDPSLLTFRGHTGWVRAAAFSPDGARVLTGSSDGTARVWDATTGTELLALKAHTSEVLAAAFSPDGTRVVTGARTRR